MSALFIIGAQRSGTTYLYNILDSHPQILMARPLRPEPKYFLGDKGVRINRVNYESLYYKNQSKGHLYLGEKSTSYIESNVAAERIKTLYPDARILIILRNPVTRAYSNYRFSVESGLETLSFYQAIKAEYSRLESKDYKTSVNPYAYKKRGHYIDYIKCYLDYFSHEQLYIIINEEFVCNINAFVELYRWLGVEQNYIPSNYRKKINSTDSSYYEDPDYGRTVNMLREEFEHSNMQLERFLNRKITAWT